MDDLISSLLWYKFKSQEEKDEKDEEREIIFEQFVHGVEDFSSQYGSEISISYTAFNIRGPPSNFPDYGDYPQAFVMRTYGTWWDEAPSAQKPYSVKDHDMLSTDYVEVSFEREVHPLEVSIFETYNPGAIVKIWVRSRKSWILLWAGEPEEGGDSPRIFTPPIRKIKEPIRIMRLEFNHSKLTYYTELDAILLKGREPKPDPSRMINLAYTSLPNYKPHVKGRIMSMLISHSHILDSVVALTKPQIKKKVNSEECTLGKFHVLPDETILHILGFLDLKSLCRMAQVNTHIGHLACDPSLYKTLDLKPYWHCADNELLYTLLDRCEHLRKLDLSWCGSHKMMKAGEVGMFIRTRGRDLTHLRLNCCKFIENHLFISIIETCHNLQELCLRAVCGKGELDWARLAELHNLRRVDFYRTDIQTLAMIEIIRWNPGLEHVNVGSCKMIESMDDVATALSLHCPGLVSVDFWKSYSLSGAGLRALARCRGLREVDVGWCINAGGSGDWISHLNLESLQKLFVGALRGVSDRELTPVAERARRLRQIDMLGVRSITQDVCTRILAGCPELQLMDVSFCDQIQEAQVVEWRKKYPSVDIKRSFQSGNLNAGPNAPFLNPSLE
ncbi:F-box/LRR-repeat protein 4 [Plutella xylostella]|uniref:F-box/LRR-repeat protein 4 n=1 Tax=Plutella xylostella TaxID=51655 RepID=UPI0020326F24|nr:F-box/LRR-repeat protein 4 [Plutella xylostella]